MRLMGSNQPSNLLTGINRAVRRKPCNVPAQCCSGFADSKAGAVPVSAFPDLSEDRQSNAGNDDAPCHKYFTVSLM